MGKYLAFMEDEKLLAAIDTLYAVYEKSFSSQKLQKLKKNIIDPFKFQFDTTFLYKGDADATIKKEAFRQSDKSIANAIGLFHQQLLGAIDGFCETPDLPTDIMKLDGTIYAEVKNKHNTMNARSAEAVFNELKDTAKAHPKAMCYLIEMIAKKSVEEVWTCTINGTVLSNKHVHLISADRFYALATGNRLAFRELCDALPVAISDYLVAGHKSRNLSRDIKPMAAKELMEKAEQDQVDVVQKVFQMAFSSYHGY